jgi:5-methylcytosine-specific restriction endonuclease McrA
MIPRGVDFATLPPRQCPRCKVTKPIIEFPLKTPVEIWYHCKACQYKAGVAYRAANKERLAAKRREKRLAYPEKTKERDRKARVLVDPEKTRAQKRAWRHANPEKVREIKARRHAAILREKRAWSKAEYAKDPRKALARKKAWAEANPEAWAVICARAKHRRRDREAAAECTLTADEWAEILRLAGNACVRCREPFGPRRKPQKDHIVPLSKGGGLTAQNCQPMCANCNNEKYVDDTDYRGLIPGLLD